MGKNYAESSLKHYLKQKVRITLGLVVTFLITGAVGFAAEESEVILNLKEQQGNYTTAKDNLSGLGAEIFKDNQDITTENGYSVTVKNANKESETKNIKLTRKDGKTTIDASAIKANTKFSFDDKLVSEKVKTNIENALTGTGEGEGKYKLFTSKTSGDEKRFEINTGVIVNEAAGATQLAGKKN